MHDSTDDLARARARATIGWYAFYALAVAVALYATLTKLWPDSHLRLASGIAAGGLILTVGLYRAVTEAAELLARGPKRLAGLARMTPVLFAVVVALAAVWAAAAA